MAIHEIINKPVKPVSISNIIKPTTSFSLSKPTMTIANPVNQTIQNNEIIKPITTTQSVLNNQVNGYNISFNNKGCIISGILIVVVVGLLFYLKEDDNKSKE